MKEEIFARVAHEDTIMTKEEFDNGDYQSSGTYFVGYEFEDGEECDENGNLLHKN